MSVSIKNHLSAGVLIGAGVLALFALVVIWLHGCEGAGCGLRMLSTLVSHAILGAIVGCIVGGIVFLFRRR
jgi:hypothetical protein